MATGKIENKIGKLTHKGLDELQDFQCDLKELSGESFEKLKTSFLRHGNIAPVFVWNGNILDGHQRVKTLRKLEEDGIAIPDKIPCVEINAGTEKEAKRYLLQYVSQQGRVTEDGLHHFLTDAGLDEELESLKLELSIPDLDMEAFEKRFSADDGPDDGKEDDTPAVPREARSKTGDMYELGDHRVLCGDATKKEDVGRLMGAEKADMVFTDPPYGINYKYNSHKDKRENYFEFMKTVWSIANHVISDNAGIYIKQYLFNIFEIYETLPSEWKFKNMIIWRSVSQAHPKDNFDNHMEMIYFLEKNNEDAFIEYSEANGTILYFLKGNPFFNKKAVKRKSVDKIGDRAGRYVMMNNIWDDIKKITGGCIRSKESTSTGGYKAHSCQMPVGLAKRGIVFSTTPKSKALDLFLGSGSTLIACEETKRRCYGMEIDTLYCDVIVQRYVDYTGNRKIKLNGKVVTWKDI